MEKSRFIFSVSVGVSLLLVGAVISAKATIGITLMLLGATLMGLAVITRNMQFEDDMQAIALPSSPERTRERGNS